MTLRSTTPPRQRRQPVTHDALTSAVDQALGHLQRTQHASGCWTGDYGGPLFLLPLYVATLYIIGQTRPLDEKVRIGPTTRASMVRYMRAHQNTDGGWGLHVEGPSMVYATCANYVALRLLGEPADDPALAGARRWLDTHDGPEHAAPWGKFMLALLGLSPYEAVLPMLPELWLLPRSAPVHPGRMWCHARMVYLPMSYLYGSRAAARDDTRLGDVRAELFDDWDAIDWRATTTQVAATDAYTPLSPVFRAANALFEGWEHWLPEAMTGAVRARALDYVLDQIRREDTNTNFICIGPINKLLDTLCWYFARPDGPELRAHLAQLPEYLWRADDGTKMQGYNSSRLWDTALATQAICAADCHDEGAEMLERAHGYIAAQQIREEVPDRQACFRGPSRGGWPFSDRLHGWPISDCTAEGLKACLKLAEHVDRPLPERRMHEAVEQILVMQNADGGWATYEKTRAPSWLELFNPAACFADIMIDYSYVECTSACVQALDAFRRSDPRRATDRLDAAVEAGADFLLDEQRDDGSWYGSWGICFTYGTWFGVCGLRAAGLPVTHWAIRRACDFLRDQQLADGGWGELADSCLERRYVSTERGQAVMTSWALLALAAGGQRDTPTFARGVRFLIDRQRDDGSWPDEHIAGVFNRTCAIHYDNYLKIFPTWALATAAKRRA